MMRAIAYHDGGTSLSAALFEPQRLPRAAVLVFPTIMNSTQAVVDKAKALADAGYLALVADFYGGQPETMDQARHLAMAIRATPQDYRRRLRASVKALAALPEAHGLPLLAIGFCMGGQAVLELARDGAPFDAFVSFHGLLDTELPAEPGALVGRILVCHGDADPMVPRERVLAFWQEMDRAGADWHFHAYAHVKHGFTNPYPSANPATAYNASADRQSWAAMHALFDEVLAPVT